MPEDHWAEVMLMRLSFPNIMLSHSVTIYVQKGINSQGVPENVVVFSGLCHFERGEGSRRTKDGELVKAASKLYVKGDIAEDQDAMKGYAIIEGTTVKYKIQNLAKFYNTDNSVHHCELEVI